MPKTIPDFENDVDPDQLASDQAPSTLFTYNRTMPKALSHILQTV